jgi:phosphate transport system substrate-binding protein
MHKPLTRMAATLLLTAGTSTLCLLQAQTAQVRAKVSSTLTKYQPTAKAQGPLEIPATDALSDLGDEWTKGFQKFQPESMPVFLSKVTTEVVKGMVAGTYQLGVTARELTADEMKTFQVKFGYMPMRIPICLDATIVFVHKDNPLTSITMEQLDAIYSKTLLGGAKTPIRLWGELGVKGDLAKRPINAYARAEGTATRSGFAATAMLNGSYRPGIIDKEDSSSLAEAVLTDPAGIAFGPMGAWYTANRVLSVVPHQMTDGRFPNQDNVTNSRYPMPRLYYIYVNRAPGKPLDPSINELLHYVLSHEGQSAVADAGLLPGPVEFLAIALKRLSR